MTPEQAIKRAETLLDSGGIFCASQWPYVAEPLRVLLSAYKAQREALAAAGARPRERQVTYECEFCDGNGWMLDEPAYGPCVCVTPASVATLRGALDERADVTPDELTRLREDREALENVRAAFASALVALGLPAHPVQAPAALAELWELLTP